MIQAGKFDDCLKQLNNSKFELDLKFEAAYCRYRLNDPHAALKILDTIASPQVKHNELRAQVLYRLEQFEKCFSVYRDIIRSSDDKYETERKTNLSAVTAQLGDEKKIITDETDTFEQRYNAAKLSLDNRSAQVAMVKESLERDMELLCVTGVEDKLQARSISFGST